MPVELALELGEDEGDRGGGASGRRGQVGHSRAGAAQVVLLGVRRIHNGLRVGDVVHRGDRAADDADLLVDDLDHGGQAVGRAAGCSDDVVPGVGERLLRFDLGLGRCPAAKPCLLGGIVQVVVAAHHDVEHGLGVLDRSRDNDLLHALVEERGQLCPGQEGTTALHHDGAPSLVPLDITRALALAVADPLDAAAVLDDDVAALDGHLEKRSFREKVRQSLDCGVHLPRAPRYRGPNRT